ncbi:MAG: DUF1153 domain-containing protein [Rhodobacteraceae bacterium]|nr:DUF1153 domain-containing protein [Paracoccaceae bacterium]
MYIRRQKGPVYVALPDGTILSRSDLPSVKTMRWVARRKATVVTAVAAGMLRREEALEMYDISGEEFDSWVKAMTSHGHGGLKVTKLQNYRQP